MFNTNIHTEYNDGFPMNGSRFVSLDADRLSDFLEGLGFSRSVAKNEVVYSKCFGEDINLQCKVYTSCSVGDNVSRGVGSDAIRIVGINDNGTRSFGVYKGARVYRTGSQDAVHSRIKARIDECFARFEEWQAEQANANSESLAKAITKANATEKGAPKLRQIVPGSEYYPAEVGDVIEGMTLKCIRLTDWNNRVVATFRNREGYMFVFYTNKHTELEEHKLYLMSFEVVGKNNYKNSLQLVIANLRGDRLVQ